GALLLSWLDRQFKETVKDSAERINFVLAAYNIGLGRVQKAQRQAVENGKNQQIWKNNVGYFLRKKSAVAAPEDSVIRTNQVYDDTFYFVDEVIATYRHYQNLIPG
ncbi:MAG: transglycosylase SLT domain-containing protein, partial [Mariniphaga sp.]|nr:transglycosylase SLT domain-containing protein [Mariniphaga sp.]